MDRSKMIGWLGGALCSTGTSFVAIGIVGKKETALMIERMGSETNMIVFGAAFFVLSVLLYLMKTD